MNWREKLETFVELVVQSSGSGRLNRILVPFSDRHPQTKTLLEEQGSLPQ